MRRFAGLVALLALTACGGQERAGSLPPPPLPSSPSTTTAAAPSPTATNEVEAAARAYYAALERAGTSGDLAALRAVVHPSCDCVRQVAAIEAEHQARRRVTTKYVVEAVTTHDVTATGGWATVTLTYATSAVVDAQGRVVRTIEGKTKVGRDLMFRKEGATWRLTRLVLLG